MTRLVLLALAFLAGAVAMFALLDRAFGGAGVVVRVGRPALAMTAVG